MSQQLGSTDTVLSGTTSLAEKFAEAVSIYSDRVAIQMSDQAITYAELNRDANRLAHALIAREQDRNLPIVLFLGHDQTSVTGILGSLKAGHFYTPLEPAFPPEHNRAILVRSEATLMVTTTPFQEQAQAAIGDLPIEILTLDTLPEDLPDTDPVLEISPEQPAALLFTSGSTGEAKGVVHTHRGLLLYHQHYLRGYLKVRPGKERFAHLFSYSFAATMAYIPGLLLDGSTIYPYLFRARGMQGFLDWVETEGISLLGLLPSIFRKLFEDSTEHLSFDNVRALLLGGEAVARGDVELYKQRFPESTTMHSLMASTEGSVIAVYPITHDTVLKGDIVPVGPPIPGCEMFILDDEGEPLPDGEIGELAIASDMIAQGYWRDPEQTARRFMPSRDGKYSRMVLTGDQARITDEGLLEMRGRQDAQIKLRGYRVDLSVIEAHLDSHPEINQAVVMKFEDPRGQDRLAAYLLPTPNSLMTSADLRDYLGQRMPEYMIPSYFKFMDSFPRTTTGKVKRLALPPPETGRPDLSVEYVKPRDSLETRLTTIWENVLGVYPIGVNDDFFELGGHSLIALQLFSQIEKDFGRALPMDALFHASTVAAFARILREDEQDTTSDTLVALREGSEKRPLFLIHPAGGHVLSYYHLIRHLDDDLPLYGLQARGLDGRAEPLMTIEEMAEHYVAEIRKVQPVGPYRLAGYSMGGKIAYEMARILHGLGETTDRLLLLDSFFGLTEETFAADAVDPAVPDNLAAGGLGLTAGIRRDWRAMRGMTMRARMTFLRKLMRQRWDWYVLRHLRRDESVSQHEMTPARRVQNACRAAYVKYTPGPYQGSLTFVRVVGEEYEDSPTLWAQVVGGEIELIEIPGSHRSILEEPDVQTLAEKLIPLLAED